MADGEFVRIAIFKLEDCSKRMLELSEQVQSRSLHHRLSLLSRELSDLAKELAEGIADGTADE
jgi:hypothetical protein